LARLDRSHIGRIKGHDGNSIARQRRELDLIARTLLMHQHDSPNITSGKSLGGQITLQYDKVQFVDHRVTILLGTNVTKRGTPSCNSTNHTTRTIGARTSGMAKGPSISDRVPKRVWYEAAISFSVAWAITASRNTRQSWALNPKSSRKRAFARPPEWRTLNR